MEDIDGALGIRATIDASDIQKSSQEWVDAITNMQTKTNEVVQGMNESLSSMQKQVEEFGKTASGMSISEISDKLNEAKAQFVELGQTIEQQKNVIADVASVVQDCSRAYKEAKESGNTNEIKAAEEALNKAKDTLALYKNELRDFTKEQQNAKAQINELTKAYKEAQSSQPSFDSLVSGAETAAQRVQALRDSFANFQSSLKSNQDAVSGLSQESANATASGDKGIADIGRTISTRYIVEGADEVQQKNEAIASGLKNVEASYTSAAATARTAFTEQKTIVSTLEGQIKNLDTIMQDAVKAGDMSSASEVAAQIQTLGVQLTQAKEKLAQLQQQSQDAQKTLGQFGEVSAEVSQKAELQSTAWGRLKDKLQSVGHSISDSTTKQVKKAKGAFSSFSDTIDGMGIPLTQTIKNFGKMTKAAWAFVSTPLGMVLGAIVLALKAVHTWLNKSAEGQKVMAQISAFFGSIMSSVTDIVIAFGKYLFKTFTGGNKAVSDFISTFVTSFKTGFSAVKNLVVGFGTIFKGVWQIITGELSAGWATLKDGVLQMGEGLADAGKTFVNQFKLITQGIKATASVVSGMFTDKDLKNSLSNSISGMIPKAKEASQIALRNIDLAKQEGEAKKRAVKLDKEIAELREKAYTLTGKEKDAALKRAKQLTKEKFYGKDIIDQKTGQKKHEDGILDVQKKQYDNLVKLNKLHTQTLKTIKAERQAKIGLLQTDATAIASTRMITRMVQANLRSMASKSKSSEKNTLNRSNAVTSANSKVIDVYNKNNQAREQEVVKVEDAIADARIAAMKDGYARTKAEREKQDKDELDKIKQQEKAAIDAEVKRQKAEYEAEQAVIKAKGGKIAAWNDKMVDNSAIELIKNQYKQLYDFTEHKQQRKNIDSLAETYDKQEQERKDKLNKLRNDIAELEEQLAKATSEAEKNELNKLRQNAKAQLDWVSQSKDAWNEYYQKYGTFLEKRAALEEKFLHDTQGLDKNSPEYKAKYEEYKQNKSSLSTSELKSNIDWSSVFSDIGMMSSKMAKIQLANLQAYTQTDEYKGLEANDKQAISEAIDKLEKEAGSQIIGSFKKFGKAVDAYRKQLVTLSVLQDNEIKAQNALIEAKNVEAQKTQELADAQEKLKQATESGKDADIQAAQKNLEAAQKNLKSAQENYATAKKNADDSSNAVRTQTDITKQSKDDVRKHGKNLTSSFDTITSVFQNLKSGSLSGTFNSIVSLVDAFKHVKEASNKTAKQQEKDAKSNSESAKQTKESQDDASKAFEATSAAFSAVPGQWAKIVSAVLSVLDILGDDLEGGIGNLAGALLEKVGNIIETLLSQIGSGKFFADLGKGVWNLVGGIGRGLGDAFGMRDNWNSYRKASEQYEKLDKVWTSLISKKKEYLSLSYGDEAKKVGEEYIELAKTDLKATKLIAKQFLGAWKKGSHSAGYKFNEKMKGSVEGVTWSDVSRTVGTSITDVSQLADLSKQQLESLKENYTEWWVKLPEKYQEYLDSIIDKQDTLDDATQDVLEKLTGVKFDNMYSNFMSALTDMSKSADDWVSDFKDKIRSAIIENMMGEKVKSWMKDYTERYQAAMKAGNGIISEAQKQQFIDEAKEMSNQFYEERKQITENVGLGKSSIESTKSSGYATASEESIEELSGRALATNEALYSIRNQQLIDAATLVSINDGLQVIVTIENKRNDYYAESIEIQRTSVSHLAAIEKNTNELYTMNAKLTKIEKNTRNM